MSSAVLFPRDVGQLVAAVWVAMQSPEADPVRLDGAYQALAAVERVLHELDELHAAFGR